MSPRVFQALMAAFIRVGLLLALVILLMAEHAQAQAVPAQPFFAKSSIQLPFSDLPLLRVGTDPAARP